MTKLPKNILTALRDCKTSLGDHPSFPPDDEEKFIIKLISNKFQAVIDECGISSTDEFKTEFANTIDNIRKLEQPNIGALTDLAYSVTTEIFSIPDDTVDIDVGIEENIDVTDHRETPEPTDDYEFDDIDDMKELTDEVYKRRMVNALVSGAGLYYMINTTSYLEKVSKINPELVPLYIKFMKLIQTDIYLKTAVTLKKEQHADSKVDVYMSGEENVPRIIARGVTFQYLLMECIKGVLELASSHGLPNERNKAEYVLKKSDFRLAERWDMRLGLPLWERIVAVCDKCGVDLVEIEPNFFIMTMASMKPELFNYYLQNVFAGTKKGLEMTKIIADKINTKKDEDDFNNYVDTRNSKVMIDDAYFRPEELNVENDE